MPEENQLSLATREPSAVAVTTPSPDPGQILQALVAHGVTQENVGALEKVCDLYERMENKKAEKLYATALAALQKECQNVVAGTEVDGKYRYATFLELWNSVRPAVERNGFTLQWDQEHLGDRVKKKLTLQHQAGHQRSFEWTIRLGTSAPGTPSGSQAPVLDEQADSRAKRRLLMDVLNIVVDNVTPAEDVGNGALASKEETDALFQRFIAFGGDANSQKRFLEVAGVEAWNQIPKATLPFLQRLMTQKERAASRKGTQ